MAANMLIAASHLAFVAGAVLEGTAVTQMRHALRQPRQPLPSHSAQVETATPSMPSPHLRASSASHGASLTLAASEHLSPEEVARLERKLFDLAKQANEHQKADPAGKQGPPAGNLNSTELDVALEVSGSGGAHEVEKLDQIVTDLVKKRRHEEKATDGKATPMGPSVQYIKGIIDNTMIPNREAAHRQDQAALDKAVENLHGCSQSGSFSLREAEASKATYQDASSHHQTCRLTEAGEAMETGDYCRESALKVERMQREWTCAKVAERKKSCIYSDYQKIVDAELECAAANKRVKEVEALCDTTRARYDTRKAKCDHWQSIMDEASCKHAIQMKNICADGDRCYESHLPVFKSTVRRVTDDEMERRAEWRALKRMQCLMDGFHDGRVTDQEVDACKQRSHSLPFIEFPEAPEKDSCKVPNKYPGTRAYKDAEFAHLPPQAKGRPEAGQCYGI